MKDTRIYSHHGKQGRLLCSPWPGGGPLRTWRVSWHSQGTSGLLGPDSLTWQHQNRKPTKSLLTVTVEKLWHKYWYWIWCWQPSFTFKGVQVTITNQILLIQSKFITVLRDLVKSGHFLRERGKVSFSPFSSHSFWSVFTFHCRSKRRRHRARSQTRYCMWSRQIQTL